MPAPNRSLTIDTAPIFEPLLNPARYKGAHGGRGSGKSNFFASLAVEDCLRNKGLRTVCIREVQKTLRDSAKLLIEDKITQFGLGSADGFKIFREVIETPGDGIIIFNGMNDHNAESIKSLEGFHRAWVEEAQTLTARSLSLLRPTIRTEDSELWFSWNPRRKQDPVDQMLRGAMLPTGAVVVQANWKDNPWFPKELNRERLDCKHQSPEEYAHIWEGEYATVLTGAYYAKHLADAKQQGRICRVSVDPLSPIKAFWDIGVGQVDATAIWVAQFVGREIRILDYYEAINQPLSAHLEWLRSRGYEKAFCYLPHDAAHPDKVGAVRYEDHVRHAGFDCATVANQGKGAAMKRIEAGRRVFSYCWFNEPNVTPGLDALGWYHEKKDEERNVGLGPDHDWSSHGADSFGLLASVYAQQGGPSGKTMPTARREWVL